MENDSDSDDLSLFNADIFFNREYASREFKYGEFELVISVLQSTMTDFDLTGQVIWPAADILCYYLLENKNIFTNSTVLEVGAGVGLCGILMSFFEDCKVVVTDHHDEVNSLLEKNVKQNLKSHLQQNIQMAKLDWGVDLDKFQESFGKNSFDFIIGSDVVFWQHSIDPLFQTVSLLLKPTTKSGNGGIFILSYQSRAQNTDKYLIEIAEKYFFEANYLSVSDIKETDNENLRFIIFKKQK